MASAVFAFSPARPAANRRSLTTCYFAVKWSCEFGQRAKMYQTVKSGYPNDEKRSFSDKFKAMLALEAQRDDKTTPEIAAKQ